MKPQRLAIIAGARTPQAKAFGQLAEFSAVDLSVHATQAALLKSQLSPSQIDELIVGNVAGPPDAANLARIIALQAGVPQDRIAHTVNRNCGSGMEAIIAGWQALQEQRAELVVAGGTESMSRIPMFVSEAAQRKWLSLGRARSFSQRMWLFSKLRPKDFRPIHGIQLGLTDPSCGLNMGQTAELLAEEFSISRTQQDEFAVESHRKAVAASECCFLSGEIVAMKVGDTELDTDVGPRANQSCAQLAKLRPIFRREGTVTAGNSCPLTDGATSLVLCSEQSLDHLDAPPLGFVSAYAIAGCDPRRMGLGPVFATAKLLQRTGLKLADFDLIEINEAFAAQVLACLKAFASNEFASEHLGGRTALGEIDPTKLNVHGGAIALGHPVGATGARLVLTLIRALRRYEKQRGLATLCVGGGQGMAMLVETT